jgi:cell division protein ZapA
MSTTPEVKQVEVAILGQSYVLACRTQEEGALHAAVAHVDLEMRAIRDLGKIKARDRIAVLAALNIAHGLLNQAAATPSAVALDLPLDIALDAAETPAATAATEAAAQIAPETSVPMVGDPSLQFVPTWRIQALNSKIDRALASDNQLL